MNVHRLLKTLALLSITGCLVFAGDATSQVRVKVELVVVPVTVTDADGKLVTNLTREDFRIFEDRKPQTIAGFDTDPQPLAAAILIDDGMNGDALRLVYPEWSTSSVVALTTDFSPNDKMMAIRYDGSVHKLSDFTNEGVVIERSFEPVRKHAEALPEEPRDLLGNKGPGFLRSFLNVLSFGHDRQIHPRSAPGVMNDAVYEAAEALKAQPKDLRRIIVIISDGRVSGRNAHSFNESRDLLLKNEIQVFAVSTDFGTFGSFKTLSDYTRATGGTVHQGTSAHSMQSAFQQIVEQARYQYVLSYVSSNQTTLPVFRKIEVRLRSGNYTVTHRVGYMQHPAD